MAEKMNADIMSLLSSTASNYTGKKEQTDPRKKSRAEIEKTQQMIASKLKEVSVQNDNCIACGKICFLAEKREVEINNKKEIYHRHCFRCAECNIQLELTSYGSINRVIYCQPHLKLHKEDILDKSKYSNNGTAVGAPGLFIPEVKPEEIKRGQKSETSDSVANKMKNLVKDPSQVCQVCNKTVYLAEKMDVEIKGQKKMFHKSCFKCSVCGLALTLRNYGSLDGVLYCPPHLSQAAPQMAKENSYFMSPLKMEQSVQNPSIGTLDNLHDHSAEYDSDDNNSSGKNKETQSNAVIKESPERREDETVVSTSEKLNEPKVDVVIEDSRNSTAPIPSSDQSVTASEDDEYEIERAKRQKERDERRRQRELERKAEEEEAERKAEERRKEREERRKRLEDSN